MGILSIELNEILSKLSEQDRTVIEHELYSLNKELQFNKNLFQNSSVGLAYHQIIVDENEIPIDYQFVKINNSFQKLTGLNETEIIGKTILQILPEIKNDKFNWIEFYGKIALNPNTEEIFEQYSTTLNRWYKVHAYSTEKYFFETAFVDITNEKTNKEELERFFDINLDLLCIADSEGNFLKINNEWSKILGYSREQLESRKFLDFVHPDDIASTLSVMQELSEQKQVLKFVNRYRCSDGTYRHIEWLSQPHGKLIYAAARDITERINEENNLKKISNFSESLLGSITDDINYQNIVDELLSISGAKYVAFNLADEECEFVTTVAISGELPILKRAASLLGFEITDKKWSIRNSLYNQIKNSSIIRFDKLSDITGEMIPRAIIKLFEKSFEIGEVVVVKIVQDEKFLGDFKLIMPKGEVFKNEYFVQVFTRQVGLFIANHRISKLYKEKSTQLNQVIDSIPDIIFFKDSAGLYLGCNNEFAKFVGQPKDKIIGNSDYDLFTKEVADSFRYYDSEMLQSGKPRHNDEWITYPDGTKSLIDTHKAPLLSADKEIIGILGVSRDKTYLEETLLELKNSKQLLELFFSKSSIGFFFMMLEEPIEWFESIDKEKTLDYVFKNQKITKVNSALLNQYGSEEKHFIGLTPNQIFKDDINYGKYIWRKLFDEGIVVHIESEETRIDGSLLVTEADYICIYDESKRILGHFVIQNDITQKKELQKQISLRSKQLRHVIDTVPHYIFARDIDGNFLLANKAFASLFGVLPNEIHTIGVESYLTSENRKQQFNNEDKQVINSNSPLLIENDHYTRLDGNSGWFQTLKVPYQHPGSTKPAVLVISTDITERKNAENEIEFERKLFSQGPVFTIVFSLQKKMGVSYISKNVKEILGYSADEIISGEIKFESIIHHEDKILFENELEFNIQNGVNHFEFSLRLLNSEGVYRWFYDFSLIQRDENGIPYSIRGYLFDQTNIKLIEESLIRERRRLNSILQGTNVGTWEWNIQTGETNFNERWADIIGYELKELAPISIETWIKFAHPEDLSVSEQLLNKHFAGELDYYEFECRMKHKNGSWIWVLDRGKVYQWSEENKPLLMSGTHQDITDRKNYETALRNSEKKHRKLIETMKDGVYKRNSDGILIEVNDAFCNILGYDSKDELLNSRISEKLYFEDDLKKFEGGYTHSSDREILRLKKKNGTEIWVEDNGWNTKNADTNEVFYEGVIRDVTDRVLSEKKLIKYASELENANNAKNKFFSIISHDLRSPFSGLLGVTQMMSTDIESLEKEQIVELSSALHDSLLQQYQLLTDLLEWAKVQSTNFVQTYESFSMNSEIEKVCDILKLNAEQKSIKIVKEIDKEYSVLADPKMINLILRNLISNAIKFTPDGGTITIHVHEANNFVEVSVRDTGVGIPSESMDLLFREDLRYTTLGTKEEKGTGLGLPLCLEIIKKNNGDMWVKSEVGIGSEFTFKVKAAKT
ncbi:MAG: PAS domain S-box protein [Ignavibacteriaceae bacterium]|nr:PAS domain S-box protein [Ignavibacteriaceae bacterium]